MISTFLRNTDITNIHQYNLHISPYFPIFILTTFQISHAETILTAKLYNYFTTALPSQGKQSTYLLKLCMCLNILLCENVIVIFHDTDA